jgi:histidinol dehydrogenase
VSDPPYLKIRRVSSPPKGILEQRSPRNRGFDAELEAYVESIIEEVRKKGDAALIEFTKRFDDVELKADGLRVSEDDIEDAYNQVSEEQVSALKSAKSRLEALEKRLLEQMNFEVEVDGVTIHSRTSPLESVGCYVPGGKAFYPSSLVMTATPAKAAGVSRVVICTPPRRLGEVSPLTLVAADLCGVDEVYRVGGAHAISALTYGTESIRPVEKIVGPGNKYVMAAKVLVSRDVPIDLPAGPSEVLVLADDSAAPRVVALDMISQAEHGVDSVSILVTTSKELADSVLEDLAEILPTIPRGGIVAEALSRNGMIYQCGELEQGISFVNEFAPEHLEIMTREPMDVAEKVTSAGLILTGPYAPVSASDYCLGVNHVLPTGGFGKTCSGLSALDFIRRVNVVDCPKESLQRVRGSVRALAEAEGLPNHASAVEGRFRS